MNKFTYDNNRFTYYENIITNMQKTVVNPLAVQQIFEKFTGEDLEEIKNKISDERDYYDLVDLFSRLSEPYRSTILTQFQTNIIPYNSVYSTKILADIDNTTIENKSFAPVYYKDKDIVPGVRSILKYFSNCKTTVGFISARPKLLERCSIHAVNRLLSGELRFSFHTGDMKSLSRYVVGTAISSSTQINTSYLEMAKTKFNNYLALVEIYPLCKFVFLGDDTQGDYYFAKMLVDHNPNNIAFIRQAVGTQIQYDILYHPRIWFHNSYFELIHRLISRQAIDSNKMRRLLHYEMTYQYDIKEYASRQQVAKDKYYYDLIMDNQQLYYQPQHSANIHQNIVRRIQNKAVKSARNRIQYIDYLLNRHGKPVTSRLMFV